MAQHDYILDNQPGAAFRSDLNGALSAIVSQNSGPTEPSTTYAYQFWADTTAGILKQRNAGNNAWISVLTLSTGQPTSIGNYLPLSGGTLSGGLTIPSLNTGQLAGLRNKIINGNFSVNQRAVSGTVTLSAGAFGHDRWKAGAGGCTYTFSTSQGVTTLTISAGTLLQVIDGANLQTGTHVLSWVGTAQARVDSGSYGTSGAVTGSAVGGSNQTIEFGTGTVSRVQYELGTVSTPFEHLPFGTVRSICQEYYFKTPLRSFILNGATVFSPFRYPVTMRATPTVTLTPEAGTSAVSVSDSTGFYANSPSGNIAACGVEASAEI